MTKQNAVFMVSDRVQWTSQAQGSWIEKIGTVVEVVPAGKRPEKIPSGSGWGFARKHLSYVVEVDQGGRRRPKLYWPVASLLEKSDD